MLYLSALIIFFAVHTVPFNKSIRKMATDKLGEKVYKLLFRLVTFSIVALGVWGWNDFQNVYFYEPPTIMKQVHLAIMFPAVYLWVVAEVPNNLKRFIRHPMLTGMKLWALGHLLANGDLRSMLLFLSFLIFSGIAVIASNKRAERKDIKPAPISYDIGVLVASIMGYSLIAHFHGNLFGMPVVQYFIRG